MSNENNNYVKNEKGQLVIPASRRPDGTFRKEKVVRDGYIPPDEVKSYESVASRTKAKIIPGLAPSNIPVKGKSKTVSANKSNNEKQSNPNINNKSITKLVDKSFDINIEKSTEEVTKSIETIILDNNSNESDQQIIEKKIKALRKKIRQIEELEERQSSGQTLTLEQLEKLSKKKEINDELEKLL
eukprot:gene18971-24782_t